jgi:hypothetical protein
MKPQARALLLRYQAIALQFPKLSDEAARDLQAWEKQFVDGSGEVGTSDWPGWAEYLTPEQTLLITEPPLVIAPSLALQCGLKEAIVLQQLHYWLARSRHVHKGRRWVYNSFEEWQKQFPWWSVRTLKRIFADLEVNGYVATGNFNKAPMDRTKWYTINYEMIPKGPLCPPIPSGQVVTMDEDSMAPAIPETTLTETSPSIPKEVWPDYYSALYSIKGFKTSLEHTKAWLDRKGYSQQDAEITAQALKGKWPGPKKSPYTDPLATWQAWMNRDARQNGRSPDGEARANQPGRHTQGIDPALSKY